MDNPYQSPQENNKNQKVDILYRLINIHHSEFLGALIAFIFIFLLMASYMIAKPVRDALASDFSDTQVAQLWTWTFICSIIAVIFYNILAARVSVRKLVPGLFIFFAATFILTALSLRLGYNEATIGKVFYVWISVFSLFHISVFWSLMSLLYSKEQSKRLFAFINVGASVGAIAGPILVIHFVKDLPLEVILYITSGVLFAVLPLIVILNRTIDRIPARSEIIGSKLCANPFRGFQEFITSKQLIGIAVFIFIFVSISTFFYMAQKDILSVYERPERKAILAKLDLVINGLTILLGIFATNRIAGKLGLSVSLAIVPAIVAISMFLFAATPTVLIFLFLQVLRKAGNYSITRPAREIFFTAVSKEARVKTKPFIDVAVYRGGDVFWVWFFVFLGEEGVLNFDLSQKLLVGAGVAIVWMLLGFFLGRWYDHNQTSENTA